MSATYYMHGFHDNLFLDFLEMVYALKQIISNLVCHDGIMLVFRMCHHKVTDHSGPSLDLSLGSCKQELHIETNLLNLVLRVLPISHELFYKRVDALELYLWLTLKDLPDVQLLQDKGGFFIYQELLAFNRDHSVTT